MQPSFETAVGFVAILQTILATLRAGSRALYLLQEGSIGVMEGPLVTVESPVYELTEAFRQCVAMAQGDNDDASHPAKRMIEYQISNVPITPEVASTGYTLSPYGHRTQRSHVQQAQAEAERLDEEIDQLLEEYEAKDSIQSTRTDQELGRVQRLHRKLSKALSTLVSPVTRTARGAFNLPRQAVASWRSLGRSENDDDLDFTWNDDERIESDLFASLQSTVSIRRTSRTQTPSSASPSTTITRTAKITAFAPGCFGDLRSFFGISEKSFQRSILETGPYVSFQSNSKGAARAGLVFFFTRDGAYMIKTIKRDEVQGLLDMLPKYYRFMQRHGERSLLTKFCGMYQVSMHDTRNSDVDDGDTVDSDDDSQSYCFVVMNSVFPAEASKLLSERFDLKGSTVGRECSAKERESKGASAVLKDLDLKREVSVVKAAQVNSRRHQATTTRQEVYGLHIGATAKSALMRQLRNDVKLLVACGAIDYSLLVGVAKEDPGFDAAVMEALDKSIHWEATLQGGRSSNKSARRLLSAALLPLQSLLAPPVFLVRQSLRFAKKLVFWPAPYYGAGSCVVDAGPLSILQGSRHGAPATYYFGLIDFLQPYNSKKAVEYRLKTLVYPSDSFSCVPPQVYADRFLAYLNEHIT
jgi:hypothetical protein